MNNTPYFFLGGSIIVILDTWGARIYTAKRGIPPIELNLLVTIVLCLIISTVAVILGSLGRVVRPLLPNVPFILTCSWFPMCFAIFALGGYLIFTDSSKA